MPTQQTLFNRLKKIHRNISKLESVKQNIGASIFSIVSSSLLDTSYDVAGNSRVGVRVNFLPSDQYLHLIHSLWSIDIGTREEIVMDVGYQTPATSGVIDIVVGNCASTYPMGRTVVETDNGIIFVTYLDTSGGSGNYDLVYKVSYNRGATWSGATKIRDIAHHGYPAWSIFIDSSNNVHVAFKDDGAGTNYSAIYYIKLTFSASTNTWSLGSVKTVAGGISAFDIADWPSIVVRASGVVVILYTYFNGYIRGILAEFSEDGGDNFYYWDISILPSGEWGGWGEPGFIPFNLASNTLAYKHGILLLRDDTPFAIWHDYYDGKAYWAQLGIYGVWESLNNGQFAFNPSGNITASRWSALVDSDHNVHVTTMNNNATPRTIEYWIYNGINWSQTEAIPSTSQHNFRQNISCDADKKYLFYEVVNNGLSLGVGPLIKKVRTGTIWGSESIVLNTSPYVLVTHCPERYRNTNFRYAVVARGTGNTFSGIQKISFYREIDATEGSIRLTVGQNTDDGTEIDDATWDPSVCKVGEDSATVDSYDMALRFTGVIIPQGATITSAILKLIANETSAEIVEATIVGIKEVNTATFSSSSRPSQRSQTTANKAWTIPGRTINLVYNSVDLKDIIQEIIDQSSWLSGNALAIVVKDNGNSDKDARFVDYSEQVIKPWYENLDVVKLHFWKDLISSDDNIGKRSMWWVIENLTADQISIRLRIKGYATWQTSLPTT